MSKSTASLGPLNNRYGLRFDVEDGAATMYLTRLTVSGSTAYLAYPVRDVEAADLVYTLKTRNRLENAVAAARYWKNEYTAYRMKAMTWPILLGIGSISSLVAHYVLNKDKQTQDCPREKAINHG